MVKSLGTGNRGQAGRPALPYIAEFKSRIAEAANTANYRLKTWEPVEKFVMDAPDAWADYLRREGLARSGRKKGRR